MSVFSPSARLPSLSEAARGVPVEVRVIVFEMVRHQCWALALRVGDVVRRLDAEGDAVVVELSDGKRVVVPRECADFIGVRVAPARRGTHQRARSVGRPEKPSRRERRSLELPG